MPSASSSTPTGMVATRVATLEKGAKRKAAEVEESDAMQDTTAAAAALQAGWARASANRIQRHPALPGAVLVEGGSGGKCGWNCVALAAQLISTGAKIDDIIGDADALGTSLR
eukprot:9669712-Alexandrium_andersonii.AAC.1